MRFLPAVGYALFHPLWVRSSVIHHGVLDLRRLRLLVDSPLTLTKLLASCACRERCLLEILQRDIAFSSSALAVIMALHEPPTMALHGSPASLHFRSTSPRTTNVVALVDDPCRHMCKNITNCALTSRPTFCLTKTRLPPEPLHPQKKKLCLRPPSEPPPVQIRPRIFHDLFRI